MTPERLHELYDKNQNLSFHGHCWDCKKHIDIAVNATEKGFEITGGAVYEAFEDQFFLKCDDCFKKDKTLRNYRPCEVYSRVVGYLRPVSQWNEGKQQEFKDRQNFMLEGPR